MIGSEVLLSLCRSPPPLMAVWEPWCMLFIFLYEYDYGSPHNPIYFLIFNSITSVTFSQIQLFISMFYQLVNALTFW